MVSFRILSQSYSMNKVFHYDYTCRRPLAPGMNTKITVTFRCVSMDDEYELLSIITKDERIRKIIICAENAIPILICKYMPT